MNKIYCLIWNAARGIWVVAHEKAAARGKSGGARTRGVVCGFVLGAVGSLPAAMAATAPPASNALPQGGVVAAGNAQIGSAGANSLQVNQSSQRAVINWSSFDIGSQAKVQFVQPNADASVLNRVLANDPTQIFGQLSANGQVYIVNPSGIVFGKGSRVDAGALVATTLNSTDDDFMAGRRNFTRGAANGSVVNEGSLNVAPGGYVALLGASVTNSGSISAPGGSALLAAGDAVQLPLTSSGRITLEVAPATINAVVSNSGEGVISAPDGQVYISATAAGSAAAQAFNRGLIDVSSANGVGGTVTLRGQQVNLADGSRILATGASGGGTVQVGGEVQDVGPNSASAVHVEPNALIDASATERGNGGKVSLWSRDYTGYFGQIRARGGAYGGNGGFVEVSSKDRLAFNPAHPVDILAPFGARGTLLLDPGTIIICHTGDAGCAGALSVSAIQGDASTTSTDYLLDTTLATALTSGNVVLTASVAIKDSTANVNVNTAAGGSLSLTAPNITLLGSYGVNGGMVLANTDTTSKISGIISGAGGLTYNGTSSSVLAMSAVNTYTGATNINTGTVNLQGSGSINNSSSVSLNNAKLGLVNVSSGAFTITSYNLNNLSLNNSTLSLPSIGVVGDAETSITSNAPITITGASNAINWNAGGTYQRLLALPALTGSGTLTLNQAGNLSEIAISGNMSGFSGKIINNVLVGNGTLDIESANGWGSGTVQVNSGSFYANYAGQALYRIGISKVAANINQPASSLIMNGGNFYSSYNVAIGALNGTGGQVNVASAKTFTTGSLNSADSYAGVIAGAGGFIKVGTGTQTLTGVSTYTGGTTLSAGTLQIGNGTTSTSSTASVAGAITDNANLVYNYGSSAASTISNTITGSGTLAATSGSGLTIAAPVTLTSSTSNILLAAGTGLAAAGPTLSPGSTSVTGGDVTLNALVSTAAGSKVTVYSGNYNTASLLSNIRVGGAQPGTASVSKTYATATPAAPTFQSANTVNLLYRVSPILNVTAQTYTKTYDGTTVAGGTPTVTGLIDGDVASSSAQSFASRNAGTGLTLNPATVNFTSGLASNYVVNYIANTTGVINPAVLTFTALTNSKIYDGNTSAAAAPTVSGLIGPDTVSGVTESYASKNVLGTNGSTLNVDSSYTINDGNGGANYTVVKNSATGTITPATLTLAALANNKTYDGTTGAAIIPTATGLVGGDTISGLSESYASKNVLGANGSTLNVNSGYTVNDGNGGANYNVVKTAASGTISPAILTLAALTNTKTYDGTIGAAATPTATGLVSGDSVTGLSESYASKNALGTNGSTLNVNSGYTVNDGNGGNNYTVNTTSAAGTIARATLTVTANNDAKLVTQADTPGYMGVSYSGFVAGENEGALGGTPSVVRSDIVGNGSAEPAGSHTGSLVPSGLSSGNYAINYVNGNYDILPADTLLVKAGNSTFITQYGSGATFSGVTAQYIDNGNVIHTLALTNTGGNSYTFDDGAGTTGSFTLSPQGAATSGSGNTVVGNYSVADGAPTRIGSNFTSFHFVGNESVRQRALTVSSSGGSKVYDGTTSLNGLTLSGDQISGDTVTESGNGAFDSRNVGAAVGYTINNLALGGADAGNYYLTNAGGTLSGTAAITPATLTLNALSNSKTYDGNTTAAAGPTATGLVAGDSIANLTESYGSKNVMGTNGSTLNVDTTYTINDGNGGANYTVVRNAATGTITPASLTLDALSNTKTYDGSTSSTATPTATGLVGGDTIGNLTESYASKNVLGANGSTLNVDSTYTINDGNGGANYAVTTNAATGTITPATLTLAALTNTKTYDGTTSAGAGPSVTGLVSGDTVTGLSESYASKNVLGANGSTLNIDGGYAVNDGNGGANYTVVTNSATGTITPASLVLTAHTNNKTYDGTTSAAAGPTASGLISGDTISGLSEAYTDRNAGTGKTLAVNPGYTINDGNGGNNYQVSLVNDTTGVITPAQLTLTANASNKVYDGTTDSSATPTVSGLQGGDLVSGLSESYADRNAGTGKTLAVNAGYSISDGNGGNNYVVNLVNNMSGVVMAAPLTMTAGAFTKTYDGTVGSSATPTVSGLVDGDTVSGLSQAYSDANAGTGKTLVVQGYTINDGNGGNNYQVTLVNNTTGVINKAALTVQANNDAKFVSQADTPGYAGLSYTGFVNGETAAVLGGSPSIVRSNAGTQSAGSYSGVLQPSGLTSNNYTISYVNGDYTIVPANELLVKLGSISNTYGTAAAYGVQSAQYMQPDGTIVNLSNSTSNGVVTIDDGAGSMVTFRIAVVNAVNSSSGNLKAGGYQLDSSSVSGNSANFSNNLVVTGNQTVNPLSVTLGIGGVGKVYDGTTDMSGLTLALNGTLAGDVVGANGSGSFANRNAGTGLNYTVSNLALGGADSSNYVLSGPNSVSGNNGVITPASLVLTATSDSKTYDGTTSAQAVPTVSGLVAGDTVTSLREAYTNQHAGTGKTLAVNAGYTINDGNGGNNYAVTLVNNTTGVITPAVLTLAAAGSTKTYDGTVASVAAPIVTGLQGSDTISGLTQSYTDKNAGSGKTLMVNGGYTINDGNGGNDYTVKLVDSASGVINQAVLALTAAPNSKTYDTTTSAAAIPTISGLMAGDTVTGLREAYADKNAGAGKALQISYLLNDGNGGGNYIVNLLNTNSGVITPAPITVTAPDNVGKAFDGNTTVPTGYLARILSGDLGEGIQSALLSYASSSPGSGKLVNVDRVVMNDGNGGLNYVVTTVPATTGVIRANVMPLNMNELLHDMPDDSVDIDVSVEGCSDGCVLQLSDIRAQVPDVSTIGSLDGVGMAPLPDGIDYDRASGQLRIVAGSKLPEFLILHARDFDGKPRNIRVRMSSTRSLANASASL